MAKKWVLIVDDDPAIVALVSEAIEHQELSVTTAGDALQAVIQAQNLKPMIIITDINMPGEDGSTILKRLREANPEMMRTVPVIFITAMDLAKAALLLPKNDPMIGLVQKPLNLEMLRGYVWKLAGIALSKASAKTRPCRKNGFSSSTTTPPTCKLLVTEIVEHPELTVATASDAEQAFILARDIKPIIIISDIQMPGFGYGTEILKRLRAVDPVMMRTVPIIFMTGMDLNEARKLLPKNDPMIGLLQKPVDVMMVRGYVWKLAKVAPPGGP